MKSPLRLIHLEDDPCDADLIERNLEAGSLECRITRVDNEEEFAANLTDPSLDLILSDFSLPGYDGLAALALTRERRPSLPFILVSGTLGEDEAVLSLKSGATDYILKSRLSRLVPAVRRALEESQKRFELAQAEEAMRQSEYKYRHLFESLSDAAFLLEEDTGRIIDTNPQAERLLWLSRDRILGQKLQTFHAPADSNQPPSWRAIADASSQAAIIMRNGRTVPVDVSAAPITLYERRLVLALYRDISQRVRAEEQIRDQARLLDLAQDAIIVRDLDGQVQYVNQAARRLSGWEAAEVIGRNITQLAYQDPTAAAEAQKTLLEKGEWSGELQPITKDGKKLVVFSRWTLLRDQTGTPTSVLSISTDITEKKKLEEQFLRVQRLESVGTLASGIAHDLNNVLAPILMSVPLLRWANPVAETEKALSIIEENAKRGADIVRQLLTFGRGLEGKFVLVEVKHLVRDMIKIITETFPKSIAVAPKVSPDLWPVTGDATQLHQVLMNLCVNARDAMAEGGHLAIRAENATIDAVEAAMNAEAKPGPYIRLSVSDTGHGIPADIQGRIFDPFFTTKPIGKGTGLGLSTVLGIVKSHGGFIKVRSETGRGTTFEVLLPAAPGRSSEDITSEPAEPKRGHGELILVVDDEVRIREMAQLLLEEHGYRVLTASDGIEAIALYAQHQRKPDLVITDLLMPLLEGASLVRGLKRMNPDVKVLVMSGVGSVNTLQTKRSELEVLGVSNILSKPFRACELLQRVHEDLHETQAAS